MHRYRFPILPEHLPAGVAFEADAVRNLQVELRDRETTHHLSQVLRLKPLDRIELFLPRTALLFPATILTVSRNEICIRIDDLRLSPAPSPTTLLLGATDLQVVDYVTEKAVEIGIKNLSIFLGEQSKKKLSLELLQKRQLRLEKIMLSAAKQSGNSHLVELETFESLEQALAKSHHQKPSACDMRLVCLTPDEARSTGQIHQNLAADKKAPPTDAVTSNAKNQKKFSISQFLPQTESPALEPQTGLEKSRTNVDIYVVVGPEGGLSDRELQIVQDYAYAPFVLSPFVLRSETAATLACAAAELLSY